MSRCILGAEDPPVHRLPSTTSAPVTSISQLPETTRLVGSTAALSTSTVPTSSSESSSKQKEAGSTFPRGSQSPTQKRATEILGPKVSSMQAPSDASTTQAKKKTQSKTDLVPGLGTQTLTGREMGEKSFKPIPEQIKSITFLPGNWSFYSLTQLSTP